MTGTSRREKTRRFRPQNTKMDENKTKIEFTKSELIVVKEAVSFLIDEVTDALKDKENRVMSPEMEDRFERMLINLHFAQQKLKEVERLEKKNDA